MRLKINLTSVTLCALLVGASPLSAMADVFAPAGKAAAGAVLDPEVVTRLNQLELEVRRMQGRPVGGVGAPMGGVTPEGDVIGQFNGKPVLAEPSAAPSSGAGPAGVSKVPSLPPPPPAPTKASVAPKKVTK